MARTKRIKQFFTSSKKMLHPLPRRDARLNAKIASSYFRSTMRYLHPQANAVQTLIARLAALESAREHANSQVQKSGDKMDPPHRRGQRAFSNSLSQSITYNRLSRYWQSEPVSGSCKEQ
jgi:hypothetical protein